MSPSRARDMALASSRAPNPTDATVAASSGPGVARLAAVTGVAAALVFLAIFRDAAFAGRLPHDVVATNDVSFVGTVYEQAAAQVRAGSVPLWFPEFDCGTPLAAAWMYGLLYPGLALFLWLPLGAAWAWTAALHAGLGAAGMAAFLRRRGCDASGAIAGAALFVVSEHFVGRTACGHLNLVLPVAWVPWMLFFADACVQGRRRAVPLFALVVAAGLLAGHVQVWIYLAPLVALFAFTEAWRAPDRRGAFRRLLGGGALAAGVVAAQIAITVEFLAEAAPIEEDAEVVRDVSLPRGVLLAKLFASVLGPEPPATGLDFRHEYRGIAGFWAFGLAAWGVRRRVPRGWFWAGAAVIGLVAALGTREPLTAWIQDVPPFSLARAPGRFLLLPLVAVPILAGHGVAVLPWNAAARAGVAIGAAALALVAGTPGVASTSSALHRTNWASRLPAEFRAHRVHSPPLYQWSNVEASGLPTLRTPCYVRTQGYADLVSQPTEGIAWWLDLGAELVPDVVEGAPFTPALEDILRTEVIPREAMGPAKFFATAEFGVAHEEILRRLRAGEQTLFLSGDRPAEPPMPQARGQVTVREWSPRWIRLEVDATGPGWVIVSTKLYPAWWRNYGPVEIDGDTGGARVGNLAFPAVRIPTPGTHEIVLGTGHSPAFVGGAAISLVCLAAALFLLVRRPRVSSAA